MMTIENYQKLYDHLIEDRDEIFGVIDAVEDAEERARLKTMYGVSTNAAMICEVGAALLGGVIITSIVYKAMAIQVKSVVDRYDV